MKLTITINTDNAAFEDVAGIEVARILRKFAEWVQDWDGIDDFSIPCHDANGNKVGTCRTEE